MSLTYKLDFIDLMPKYIQFSFVVFVRVNKLRQLSFEVKPIRLAFTLHTYIIGKDYII